MSTQNTGTRDIVLIHGLWMTPKSWEGWAERFRGRGHAVHAPSWPGLYGEPEELRRDLSRVPDVSVEQIVDHYDGVIRGLDRPPIVIGHSFGGAFTQLLLDRGLGAAGVAVNGVATKDVFLLPFSTIRSMWGILKNPRNRSRAVPFTPRQFRYAWGNTVSEEESRQAWERYAIPGVGRVVFQGALANFSSPFKVDYGKADRAPLLFVAGGNDHAVPASVNRSNVAKYKRANPDAVVEYKEYPSRSHFTVGAPGWEEVADYALDWAIAHASLSKGVVSTIPRGRTMHFDCHPVDASFFDSAPMRFRHEVELDATPAKVFAIFDAENSWPKWFHAIHKVEWTSPRPHGVGSTRTVTLAMATVFEHFFCWEQDRRCSFYLTGASMPLVHAMVEDYLLEELAPGKTHFTYRVGIEPRMLAAAGGPLSHMYFDSTFKSACEHLQTYVQKV